MERSFKLKKYDVVYTADAVKSIKKIDKIHQIRIQKWIQTNLEGCSNPYFSGIPLKGNKKGEWRYRIGNYRIIAHIDDTKVTITIINVGHRQSVYKN